MTLGELIDRLQKEDPKKQIKNGFGEPFSYRGYYEQLAFPPKKDVFVGEMLGHALSAVGREFTGYKGGEYTMETHTEVNLAEYGMCHGTDDALSSRLLEYMLADSTPPQSDRRDG